MEPTQETRNEREVHSAALRRQLAELTAALVQETAVVRELSEALIEQRAGVAGDDTNAVNASVDAMGRILLTLQQARLHRARLVESIAGDSRLPLDRLDHVLGLALPAELEAARAELRRAARQVAQEVAINHGVLKRAVEAGEAFIQALFSAGTDPAPVYGTPEQQRDERISGAGVLLNRRA